MVGLRRRLQIRLLCPRQRLILAEIFVWGAQRWTHDALVHGTYHTSRIKILRLLCLASVAARTVVTNRRRGTASLPLLEGRSRQTYDVNESSSVLQKTRAQHRVYGQP